MNTLQIEGGDIVQVSEDVYTTTTDPGLFRKIGGLFGHPELGWHPEPGWVCLVAEETYQKALVQGSVPLHGTNILSKDDVYIGFHQSWIIPPRTMVAEDGTWFAQSSATHTFGGRLRTT